MLTALALPLLLAASSTALAEDDADITQTITPYDRTLSAHPYPHEVHVHTIEAQGRELSMAYMDVAPQGEARGTVLLLHGKNFSGAYWERTIELLVGKGYRVIVPDQVGFGRSSKPLDIQYSFHAFADWTVDLLDARGVSEAAVVGHSMGGMVATRLVLDHPDRASSLVLLNPIGLEDWRRTTPYRSVDAWTESNLRQTPAGVKAYMQNAYFDGAWKPRYDPLIRVQAGWSIGPDREHMARVSARHYDMIYSQPVVHEFPDVSVPTLLVIGERDRTALNKDLVSDEVRASLGRYEVLGEQAAAAIPDATLVELPGVGHAPQVEKWGAWKKALLGFLAERG